MFFVYYVAVAALQLQSSSFICLPSSGIKGAHCHVQPLAPTLPLPFAAKLLAWEAGEVLEGLYPPPEESRVLPCPMDPAWPQSAAASFCQGAHLPLPVGPA